MVVVVAWRGEPHASETLDERFQRFRAMMVMAVAVVAGWERANLDIFPDFELLSRNVELGATDEGVVVLAQSVERELVREVDGAW